MSARKQVVKGTGVLKSARKGTAIKGSDTMIPKGSSKAIKGSAIKQTP